LNNNKITETRRFGSCTLRIGIDELAHFSNNAKVRKNDSEWVTYKIGYVKGVETFRTQDTSDLWHFGTIRLVPKCPDSSVPVPKCLADTSGLVPNCL